MNNYAVSILVPVYNVDKYLRQCLESIVHQTLENIEIICINDGSTDRSKEILEEFASKDKRIVVINKQNSGYGHSMNVGMSVARGQYIGIVESDDFVSSEMFERLYYIATSKDVDVVKSNYIAYKSQIAEEKRFVEVLKTCEYDRIFSPAEQTNIIQIQGCIWSALYRKAFIKENGISFNETRGASYQDVSFNVKVWLSAQKVYLVKDAFYFYRSDNQNSSVKSVSKVFCVCDEFSEVNRFISVKSINSLNMLGNVVRLKYQIYYETYLRLAPYFQYAFLIRFRDELYEDYSNGFLNKEHFDLNVYKNLSAILDSADAYFEKTSKAILLDNINSHAQYNANAYFNGVIDALSRNAHVIVFGAGKIAEKVANTLIHDYGVIPHGFAVTSMEQNPQKLLELDVKPIHEYVPLICDSIVILAVGEKCQIGVYNMLEELSFERIFVIDSIFQKNFSLNPG